MATFAADITPPIGKPVGLGFIKFAKTVEHPLLAKGVVLSDAGGTYVLCSLDLMEVHNGSYDLIRTRIAQAAGTSASHVAVHALHQHTAPALDSDAQSLQLEDDDPRRVATHMYEVEIAEKIAMEIRKAIRNRRRVTHVGTSQAKVDRVASNRRIRRKDGIITARMSSAKDLALRNLPQGRIDPWLKTISFFDGDQPVVRIHYYATHPQSFYGDSRISYDTVGMAREQLQKKSNVFQIYFTGCGGDVAMGKYNDGTKSARTALTARLYDAMERSVANVQRHPLSKISWRTATMTFPRRLDAAFSDEFNRKILDDPKADFRRRLKAAITLAWNRRESQNRPVELSCLTLGSVQILHLCGEPFVQYQLAAQKLSPNSFVAVAGYGDCGMAYIGGDEIFTDVGGYEQSWSFSGPCQQELLSIIDQLLTPKQGD